MCCRATDFYVQGDGEGLAWLGSICFGGPMPHDLPYGIKYADNTADYVYAVTAFLMEQPRGFVRFAQDRWPWPWPDSSHTTNSVCFRKGKTWRSRHGCNWEVLGHAELEEEEEGYWERPTFPDMAKRSMEVKKDGFTRGKQQREPVFITDCVMEGEDDGYPD